MRSTHRSFKVVWEHKIPHLQITEDNEVSRSALSVDDLHKVARFRTEQYIAEQEFLKTLIQKPTQLSFDF